jgi:DNA-binding cell septation regulator SpoVG
MAVLSWWSDLSGMLHSVKGIDPKDAKSLVAIFDRQTKEREGEFPEGFHPIGRHERDDAADPVLHIDIVANFDQTALVGFALLNQNRFLWRCQVSGEGTEEGEEGREG